jgi:hypothetical protein
VSGDKARAQAATYAFWQPHLLLTSDTRYRRLEIEIDHVEGAGPSAKELKALTEFFETHCRKPDGVRIRVDAAIPRARAKGFGPKSLTELHLDGPTQPDTAFAYFLFYDSRVAGLPRTSPSTTRAPFPGAVLVDRRYLTTASWFPGAGDVARRLLLHEAGHVLGLCANQSHADGIHCTNRNCLMNVSLFVRPLALFVPGRRVAPQREFCPDCQVDLKVATPPADNLRFLGPYCVRTEPGYHVVSSPAYSFVHVGPLEKLDLTDVQRRRREIFSADPKHDSITSQTAEISLTSARNLIPQLARDPLESLRNLAADLKQKLAAIEESQKNSPP